MINFWATWCGPVPPGDAASRGAQHQRYSNLGFTLLGVNVEADPEGATKYLQETPVSFLVLFDPKNEVSKLYKDSSPPMPSTVLVGRDGSMCFIHHTPRLQAGL